MGKNKKQEGQWPKFPTEEADKLSWWWALTNSYIETAEVEVTDWTALITTADGNTYTKTLKGHICWGYYSGDEPYCDDRWVDLITIFKHDKVIETDSGVSVGSCFINTVEYTQSDPYIREAAHPHICYRDLEETVDKVARILLHFMWIIPLLLLSFLFLAQN